MYDELVKRLIDAAKMSEALAVLLPHSEGNATAKLYNEAADAIEELNAEKAKIENSGKLLAAAFERLKEKVPKWISVEDALPEEFVSVQAHMTDAGQLPSVREGYLAGGKWYFPALNEYHPVDKWAEFLEPPKEVKTNERKTL